MFSSHSLCIVCAPSFLHLHHHTPFYMQIARKLLEQQRQQACAEGGSGDTSGTRSVLVRGHARWPHTQDAHNPAQCPTRHLHNAFQLLAEYVRPCMHIYVHTVDRAHLTDPLSTTTPPLVCRCHSPFPLPTPPLQTQPSTTRGCPVPDTPPDLPAGHPGRRSQHNQYHHRQRHHTSRGQQEQGFSWQDDGCWPNCCQ